jgi:hypothetical protein
MVGGRDREARERSASRPGWPVLGARLRPWQTDGTTRNFSCVTLRDYSNADRFLDDALVEDFVSHQILEQMLEEFGMDLFGVTGDAVDALYLAGYVARQVSWTLYDQVGRCRDAGHSWEEIGAALGISRQAAAKRFERPFRESTAPLRPTKDAI